VTKYEYDERTKSEVERMVRDALPRGSVLHEVSLDRDFGGVDVVYRVNHRCDLQTRCRFNRPWGSWAKDITFRKTEPRMISDGTYAPLAIFIWFQDGWAEVGRLIDIYRMDERIIPPLPERVVNYSGNGDFVTVDIAELVGADALLRGGDRNAWATWATDGERRLARLLEKGALVST
jgi:hypothetical protein